MKKTKTNKPPTEIVEGWRNHPNRTMYINTSNIIALKLATTTDGCSASQYRLLKVLWIGFMPLNIFSEQID